MTLNSYYAAKRPLSTGKFTPVINAASSLAR
jgi:hypothetical protein